MLEYMYVDITQYIVSTQYSILYFIVHIEKGTVHVLILEGQYTVLIFGFWVKPTCSGHIYCTIK